MLMVSFNTTVRQITEMFQQKMTEVFQRKKNCTRDATVNRLEPGLPTTRYYQPIDRDQVSYC